MDSHSSSGMPSFLNSSGRSSFTLDLIPIARRGSAQVSVKPLNAYAHRKARMGRNPATGEAIKIKAKTVVKMRLSKTCKDAIIPPKK